MGSKQISLLSIKDISKNDVFIADTNILFFAHSGYFTSSTDKDYDKFVAYSSFLAKLLANGNKICTTVANLQELFHVIENKEFLIYRETRCSPATKRTFYKKDFRKLSSERLRVQSIIKRVNMEIQSCYEVIEEIPILSDCIKKYVDTYNLHLYDPIDYIVVYKLLSIGYNKVISDDKDFECDSSIELFTI